MDDLSKLFDEKIKCVINDVTLELTPVLVDDFIAVDKHLKDSKKNKIIEMLKIFDSEVEREKLFNEFSEFNTDLERDKFLRSFEGVKFVFVRIIKRSYEKYTDEEINSLISIKNMKSLDKAFNELIGMKNEIEGEKINPIKKPKK